jgi:Ni,Fe-hydrogenase III small subunit
MVAISKNCVQIQSLSINSCNVTVVGVKALLDRCYDMRELSIKNCVECRFDATVSQGNGGMQALAAVGEEVLARLQKRRVALLR